MSLENVLVPNILNVFTNSLTLNQSVVNPGGSETLWVGSNDHLFKGSTDLEAGIGPMPLSNFIVYVQKGGNDTSGNGSLLAPYLTVTHAMTTITNSAPNFPVVISVGPGIFAEPSLKLKGNVFILGGSIESTQLNISSSFALDTGGSWSTSGLDIGEFASCRLNSSGTITADFSSVMSTNGRLNLVDVVLTNSLTVIPFAITNSLGVKDSFFPSGTISFTDGLFISINSSLPNLSIVPTIVSQNTRIIDSSILGVFTCTSAVAFTITIFNSQAFGVVFTGPITTTGNSDFLPSSPTLSGGSTFVSINDCVGLKYTPSVSGNWPSIPNSCQQGLDDLAVNVPAKSFYVYPLASQSIPNNTPTVLTYVNGAITHPYQLGGLVAATGLWTCPLSGVYSFALSGQWDALADSTVRGLTLKVNASYVIANSEIVNINGGNQTGQCVNAIVKLSTSDTVQSIVFQNSVGALNFLPFYFSGIRLSS